MATDESLQPAEKSAYIDDASDKHKGRYKTRTNQKTARIVGALFLISNVTFLLGSFVLVEAILGSPDYLNLVSADRNQMVLGVLLELINGIAYLGIAALMFPIFKLRFESMAIAYVSFRIIEFIMQTLSGLSPLSILTLSEEFVTAGAVEDTAFQISGTLLLAERYWAFQMVSIIFGLGALLFYYMMFQCKLIPRFVSIWGLIGAAFVLASTVLDLFGLSSGNLGNLGILMLLNELFLGVWLIVKGFSPSAFVSPSTAYEDRSRHHRGT